MLSRLQTIMLRKQSKAPAAQAAQNADVLATSPPGPGLPTIFEEDTAITDEEIWYDCWNPTDEEMYELGRKVRFHEFTRIQHVEDVYRQGCNTRCTAVIADYTLPLDSRRKFADFTFRRALVVTPSPYNLATSTGNWLEAHRFRAAGDTAKWGALLEEFTRTRRVEEVHRQGRNTRCEAVIAGYTLRHALDSREDDPMDIDVDDSNDTVANVAIPAVHQARLQWTDVPYIEQRPAIHSFTFSPPSEVNVPAFNMEAVASTRPIFIFGATRDVPCETSVILSDDPPGNTVESVVDNEEVDLAGLNDDQMDTSSDLTPTLSIPAGGAREVPPRETSTKGRRLRKELESSLDGRYWALRSATRR